MRRKRRRPAQKFNRKMRTKLMVLFSLILAVLCGLVGRLTYIEHTYGNAYELPSPHTEELTQMIWNTCREHGIMCMPEKCFSYLHQYPEKYVQQSLFMS